MRQSLRRQGFAVIVKFRSFQERSIELGQRFMGAARCGSRHRIGAASVSQLPIGRAREFQWVPRLGTTTITMHISDIDQSEIPAGKVYQLSIRHPDGATQQLDISEKNYRALNLKNMGKTLKKRGRKPGSTTKATRAASTPPTRRRRQNTKRPATA